MIAASSFKGKKVALFGLGGSGLVTAQSLMAGGAELIAWDDNPDQVKKSSELGIPTGDLHDVNWVEMSALVLAPGVPLTHPKPHWSVELATESGTEIIGDIELFVRERKQLAPDCPFIAITGTNGKSTTTALIAHILESSGKNVQMGGNIGTAILSLDVPSDDKFYVVECSSYQIDLAPSLDPSAGILLNLSPDHLDRHGTMEHYADVKERLVAQSKTAIVGVDDDWSKVIAGRLQASGVNTISISVKDQLENGIYFEGAELQLAAKGVSEIAANIDNIPTLRGLHNAQNAAAAFAACMSVGLSKEEIGSALQTFPGLKHRMQPIARLEKILFINDSKATNAEATAPALKSYDDIFWIVGGLEKDGGISALMPLLERISKAYLIGSSAPSFAAELGGKVDFEIANEVDAAVLHAAKDAKQYVAETGRDPVILFSPSCASFDQFRNFEIRGDRFVECVAALDDIEMLIPHQTRGSSNG